jgi:hypothetical protein
MLHIYDPVGGWSTARHNGFPTHKIIDMEKKEIAKNKDK